MFEETLSKIGSALGKHNIPYIIIGGQAVLLYGEPRLTRDIDITLGVNVNRLQKIKEIIKQSGLTPIPKNPDHFVKQTMVLPSVDDASGIRVDFIFSFTPYEQEAISRANKVRIMGCKVCFASVEDLIIHKIFAGRQRDMEDVKIIILKNPDADIGYIRKWLKEFDSGLNEKKLLAAFERILRNTGTGKVKKRHTVRTG